MKDDGRDAPECLEAWRDPQGQTIQSTDGTRTDEEAEVDVGREEDSCEHCESISLVDGVRGESIAG